MNRLILTREQQKALIDGWFSDPDTWVGIFENHDLGHPQVGLRCAFPFRISDGSLDKAEVNKTRAPDGRTIGLGWRYLLVAKCKDADATLIALRREQ